MKKKPTKSELKKRYLAAWKTWCAQQPKFMRAIDEVIEALGRERGLDAMNKWERGEL